MRALVYSILNKYTIDFFTASNCVFDTISEKHSRKRLILFFTVWDSVYINSIAAYFISYGVCLREKTLFILYKDIYFSCVCCHGNTVSGGKLNLHLKRHSLKGKVRCLLRIIYLAKKIMLYFIMFWDLIQCNKLGGVCWAPSRQAQGCYMDFPCSSSHRMIMHAPAQQKHKEQHGN